MACDGIKVPGGFAIVCGRRRAPKCWVSHCPRPGERECDYPAPGRKSGTCDRKICAGHSLRITDNVDYCPEHAITHRARQAQPTLFSDNVPGGIV